MKKDKSQRELYKKYTIGLYPSIDNAAIAAVKISEKIKPSLTEKEQAIFISGFQECIKWISSK